MAAIRGESLVVIWNLSRRISFALSFGVCLFLLAPAAAKVPDSSFNGDVVKVSQTDVLKMARQMLDSSDVSGATKAYALLPFGTPMWTEKVEDLIRHHLLNGSSLEAWRLVQLLKRVRLATALTREYEKLAVFKSLGCPLALHSVDAHRNALLNAASYRFQSVAMSSSSVSAVEGTSFGPGITPFLADIPRARILRGQGCRLAKFAGKTATRPRLELDSLLVALKSFPTTEVMTEKLPRLLVLARALQLHSDIPTAEQDSKLAAQLERFLPTEGEINWSEVPDEERRRLFSRYFPGEQIVELPVSLKKRAHEIAMQILKRPVSVKDVDWLSMVDLSVLTIEKKIALFSAIEKTGTFAGRAWVLYSLAEAYYELEKPMETLAILRRMLREKEEETDAALDEAMVDLAARIFSEHRFDERLLGAMQAAMPSRLWWQMVDSAAIRAAIYGRDREFLKIQSLMLKKNALSPMLKAQVSLWSALAKRDQRSFSKQLRALDRGGGTDRLLRSLGGIMASEFAASVEAPSGSLASDAWKEVSPFAQELAVEIRSRIRPGDTRANELADLSLLLERESAWADGGRSVKNGAVVLGVARFKRRDFKKAEFRLKPPATIPLRELIYLPDKATARGWTFSTTIR